jgi:CheY-like chemotaxis protein
LNKGTSFFIEIPFKKIEDKKLKNIAVSKTECSIKNKRILVADDDLLNQTIVAHYLKKQQANSTIVSDGLEALEKIETEVFDVILLDINMPNMTGEELVTKNKSFLKFNSTTPILALTANATKEDIKRYKKAGFLDVISKPFTSKKFVEKICSVLFS